MLGFKIAAKVKTMVNIKWDLHNMLTIGLMVLVMYTFAGTIKATIASVVTGAGNAVRG